MYSAKLGNFSSLKYVLGAVHLTVDSFPSPCQVYTVVAVFKSADSIDKSFAADSIVAQIQL